MNIKWVNHASYIVSFEDIKMISDPWIEGRVFNESWELLAKSAFKFEDFKDITHLWFSHEHPDHFFPPNIKMIPENYRKNITVLFQKTNDSKVASYCRKIGFKEVIEIEDYTPFKIRENLEIVLGKVSNDTDSWMYLKSPNFNLLNLNDCVFNEQDMSKLSNYVDKVDVLLTQFSFANWVGNKGDTTKMNSRANEKLDEIKRHITTFKPKFTIPFASYVWFCNEDNFHFNQYANKIDKVSTFIKSLNSEPVILYPNDVWYVGETHDSSLAISKYLNDEDKLSIENAGKFKSILKEELLKSSEAFTKKALEKNNKTKLLSYKPMIIYLTDYQEVYSYSYKSGLQKSELDKEFADISFHSQNLQYCFKFDWGFDTILVAGTFEKPPKGNFQNYMEYQWVASLNNQGKRMKGLLGRVLDKIKNIS